MAATNLTKTGSHAVARPIKVLVPLIKEDIANGRAAAERAGMPYYIAAGEKLLEARPQFASYREFISWTKRQFDISATTSDYYLALAREIALENPSALGATTMSQFVRENKNPNYNRPPASPSWQEPVKKIAQSVDYEALRRDDLKRAEEREEERLLGLKLIDIGYKVLAQQMHPDKKGGSNQYFARLKSVRDRLKNHV